MAKVLGLILTSDLIIILMLGNLARAALLTRPVNQVVWDTTTSIITMNCSSDRGSSAISWLFTLFDTTNAVTVANGSSIASNYTNVYRVEQPNSSASNLIIFRVSSLTAGTYTCTDGSADVASAQKNVITNAFQPQGNITAIVKNGDVFYYTCSACFYGNSFMIPQLYLMVEYPVYAYNFTNPEITKIGSMKCGTGTVIDTATCTVLFQNSRLEAYFTEPRGNLPSGSATNAPVFSWITGFLGPLKVTCVPTEANITVIGPSANNLLTYGDTITCNVASSTPVNYTWTDLTYGNTSKGQQLSVWHNGSYQCDASTEQDGKTYTASKTFYNLIVLAELIAPSDSNMSISGQTANNSVQFGDTLTCNAPSSTPVSYTWTDLTYGNTSKGQQLRVWHNGTYQCNASTQQGGKIISASKTIYNLIVKFIPTDNNMNISGQTVDNVVQYGETITCSVPSSTPVNYTWTDFTYGNTSKEQQLRVWHNGTYQCNASTEQDGRNYSASKTLYIMIVVPVKNVPTDAKMNISGQTADNLVQFGETLTCNVTSSTPVSYTWTDLTYGNTSKGQILRVWHNGTYQCNASTEQDGKNYSASKTLYIMIVVPVKSQKISLTATPLFGPVVGGTKMNFTIVSWSDQITNISAVYIGDSLAATIVNIDIKKKVFQVLSPAATDALVQQPLQIKVECSPGPFNFTTDLTFTYRWNPEITNLYPNSFIVTGGTLVNVNGSGLSSVSNPLIQVTVDVSRINASENYSNTTTDSCTVQNSEGTQMVCRMPPVYIPKEFQDILDLAYQLNKTSDFPKSNSSVLKVVDPNGTASVRVGFILDGYKKYENINNVLPDTRILFYSSPEINSSKTVCDYDASADGLVHIQGKYLSRGCRLSDYVVRVGNSVCENIALQDNDLTVRLPKTEPQLTQDDSITCGNRLNMRIIIGYKEYHYCCLSYNSVSSYKVLIIAVCVSVGGFVLLIIAIIGILCCCRRYRKDSSGNDQKMAPEHRLEFVRQFYEGSDDLSEADFEYGRTIDDN